MDIWSRPGYYYPIPNYGTRYSAHLTSYLRCTCECYCDQTFDPRSEALQRVRRLYEVRGIGEESPKEINDVFSVVKPGRRNRTTYKRWQIEELERAFLINPYPTSVFKKTLALRLGLRDSRVQVWFQNRRAKSKRDHQSCHSPTFSATTMDHESDNFSTYAEDNYVDHCDDVSESQSNVDVETGDEVEFKETTQLT